MNRGQQLGASVHTVNGHAMNGEAFAGERAHDVEGHVLSHKMNEHRSPSRRRYDFPGQFFASLGNLKHSLETEPKRLLRRLCANAV